MVQKRAGFVRRFYDNADYWTAIENHAKARMYTDGGSTTVFYFDSMANTPDVTRTAEQFDAKYEKHCIAAYWKYPTGEEQFKKYPFK